MKTADLYEFGPFRLDPVQGLLFRGEKIVSLTPKAVETLAVLVEHRGEVVTKDELLQRIWPDTFVEEGTVARNVSFLRKALGEPLGGGDYIETHAKRGYRFVAEVHDRMPVVLEAKDFTPWLKDGGAGFAHARRHRRVAALAGVKASQ